MVRNPSITRPQHARIDVLPTDPANVQCCVPKKCSAPYKSSLCRKTSTGCAGGSFVSGHCPGDSSIKCCVQTPEADKPSCSNPAENTCTFYTSCLEKEANCGAEGYPIGYGAKYCKDFTNASSKFATHPGCYVSSGVCALPPNDWEVIISTVSIKELFGSVDALKATLRTGGNCVEFYQWLIERGIVKVVDKVKDKVEDVWEKVTDFF
jgi:hypothetical protein